MLPFHKFYKNKSQKNKFYNNKIHKNKKQILKKKTQKIRINLKGGFSPASLGFFLAAVSNALGLSIVSSEVPTNQTDLQSNETDLQTTNQTDFPTTNQTDFPTTNQTDFQPNGTDLPTYKTTIKGDEPALQHNENPDQSYTNYAQHNETAVQLYGTNHQSYGNSLLTYANLNDDYNKLINKDFNYQSFINEFKLIEDPKKTDTHHVDDEDDDDDDFKDTIEGPTELSKNESKATDNKELVVYKEKVKNDVMEALKIIQDSTNDYHIQSAEIQPNDIKTPYDFLNAINITLRTVQPNEMMTAIDAIFTKSSENQQLMNAISNKHFSSSSNDSKVILTEFIQNENNKTTQIIKLEKDMQEYVGKQTNLIDFLIKPLNNLLSRKLLALPVIYHNETDVVDFVDNNNFQVITNKIDDMSKDKEINESKIIELFY